MDFGYRTITVERPLKDEQANIVTVAKGKNKGEPQPDSSLRDTENVPLNDDVEKHFKREVLPHVPDAWIDHDKTKVGYEIPFNRNFYVFNLKFWSGRERERSHTKGYRGINYIRRTLLLAVTR